MISKNVEPIFIHSLFRSGSTYFFHAIKRTGNFHVYHEPFHEIIRGLPVNWNSWQERTKQLKDILRHDFLDGGYFDEYAHLLDGLEKYFKPEISYELFFLSKNEDSPILKSYVDCLINGSLRLPVLQCTRTTGRIAWFKENYRSKNIFLLRNPWDQWFSYKVDSYVSSTPQLIYSQPRLPIVLQEVAEANNFILIKGQTIEEQLNYCLSHPIAPDVDYSLFFGLWLFSLLAAYEECDLILDMDSISRDHLEQLEAEQKLAKVGLTSIDLSDCALHRTIFKANEASFYKKIEEQVFNLFQNHDAYANRLWEVEQYLEHEREISFFEAAKLDSTYRNILEDASRMRASLLSAGQDLSQTVNSLNQNLQEVITQLETIKQEVDEQKQQAGLLPKHYQQLRTQHDEILKSKAWKIGLFLQRTRIVIAPPNSLRGRVIRWLINVVFSPLRRIRNKKRWDEEVNLLISSPLFDESWYLQNNPDVAEAKVDPIVHYLRQGGFEGRDPSLNFSSGWYLESYKDVRDAGINPLVHYLKFGMREGRTGHPSMYKMNGFQSAGERTSETGRLASIPLTIFTICSRKHTAHAKTLFETVKQHHPNAKLFMFLCDDIDAEYRKEVFPFHVVPLYKLRIPYIVEVAQRGNMMGLISAIKPYAFNYLFDQQGNDQVLYLDPHIILLSPLQEVAEEFVRGADCILSSTIFVRADNLKQGDLNTLGTGVYDTGILGLRKTTDILQVVNWWSGQLLDQNEIGGINGSLVHQNWLEIFPALIKKTSIIHHPGYNVAFENLSQRHVELIDGAWFANGEPLRSFQFSENNVGDSSHSTSLSEGNLGNLDDLLDSYRRHLLANGYAEYSNIPVSFRQIASSIGAWISRILVIDSSTPRPDRDAGSLSTFNLLKIYQDLGYDVTFIPSDLLDIGEYTEDLRKLGIHCLHQPEINSVEQHLEEQGDEYDFVILCRAHIAALHLGNIRLHARKAKILFDTIDLNYLRYEREARLTGSQEKVQATEQAKQWELDLIRQSDVTIVLSSAEAALLKRELDNADIRLIPLIFVENVYDIPPFEERKDFLFIGGFPHLPNIDAVVYFCAEILPLIRERLPDVTFHIIGDAPPPQVLDLANQDGVIVHGYVKDITSMFRKCRLSVAPLRFGAGIKGKIATSLAYGVPVIASKIAAEGMELESGKHLLIAEDPQQFANSLLCAYESKELWTQLSQGGRYQALRNYSEAAGYRRISRLMQDINPNHKQIDLYTLRSFEEYDLLRKIIAEEIEERKVIELNLIKRDQPNFLIDGFCAVCGRESKFSTNFMHSHETTDDGKMIPNWREHLTCLHCGFSNRLRATMHILSQRLRPPTNASIYITEQTTPVFKWLKNRHAGLVGSEYFGRTVPFGSEKDGLRNEDLTALTFPNNSFDYILSFDVMEHVSDDNRAFKEVYRCMKPGGIFLFTAPFLKARTEKLVRARVRTDGSIEHILPAEYHANPVDQENGSLCFRYFAWDLIDDLKRIGFEDPRILNYWSLDFAYLGGEQFIFIAAKSIHNSD